MNSLAAAWTDSHCHLQDVSRNAGDGAAADVEGLLDRAAAAGVDRLVCVGTGPDESLQAAEIARRASGAGRSVWATAGIHPHEASVGTGAVAAQLASAGPFDGAPGSIVAVGECGLDFHYDHSPRPAQRSVFAAQIALAKEHGLALVVHTRQAWDETVDILSAEGPPERTIIHCFTGGPDEARRCLDLGCYLSFSGIVTFKQAGEIRAAAVACPLDRMLVETDAPFLTPVPYRGKPNEPAFVALVGSALAELRSLDPAAFADRTTANAAAAFALSP